MQAHCTQYVLCQVQVCCQSPQMITDNKLMLQTAKPNGCGPLHSWKAAVVETARGSALCWTAAALAAAVTERI